MSNSRATALKCDCDVLRSYRDARVPIAASSRAISGMTFDAPGSPRGPRRTQVRGFESKPGGRLETKGDGHATSVVGSVGEATEDRQMVTKSDSTIGSVADHRWLETSIAASAALSAE
jgi:hypothetical protein